MNMLLGTCSNCDDIFLLKKKIDFLEKLVMNHEAYLKKIEEIALCDPDKIAENHKILNDKIEKLEKWKSAAIEKNIQDVERIRNLEDIQKEHLNKLAELSMKLNMMQSSLRTFEKERIDPRFEKLEEQIKELLGKQDFHQALTNAAIYASKKPYKCPVCGGKGLKPTPETLRFYILMCDKNPGTSACFSCQGTGIVWG